MRLSIEYELSSNQMPKDYRRVFMSLIKKAIQIENSKLFERYYNGHKIKPFTFSVYFPELKGEQNGYFIVGNKARLDFSTSQMELGTQIYNGLISIDKYSFFEGSAMFRRKISLWKAENISTNEVTFKTIGPVLVNNIGSSDKYLLPGEEGFLDGLRFAVNEVSKAFLKVEKDITFEFTPLQWKRKVIWHYKQKRPAFVGMFNLRSEAKILQLTYDIGIGVRRNQGFGMLEVVK